MQREPFFEAEAAKGVETVEEGEGLVEDLHAYLKSENVVKSARCSQMESGKAVSNVRSVYGGSQSKSAPSRDRVSRRLVQPLPWSIYRLARFYILDLGRELYILNEKNFEPFRDLCYKACTPVK